MPNSDPHEWLVAHRGHASVFPENSLGALRSALRSGVRHIEFDVQLTRDQVPVVIHDANLRRTGGVDLLIARTLADDLVHQSIGEPERLGSAFESERLPRLSDVVELFADWPDAVPVAEIKSESALPVGVDRMVARVLNELEPVRARCIVISFVERAVQSARRMGARKVGWCLAYYDDDSQRLANVLEPDYLLVNYKALSNGNPTLWSGPWQWMTWEVVDPDMAVALRERGVEFIETMACTEMLQALSSPRLAGGSSA